jgi:hypothetical protein
MHQKAQTFAHGTGAYNALAGPANQKRLAGPQNTSKAFQKTSHAGAPAFAFRAETGKKVPTKSEKELGITWVIHLVTWTEQTFPNVENVAFLGKPYFYATTTTNTTNTRRNTTPSARPSGCTRVPELDQP